jgi:hypothetical protein
MKRKHAESHVQMLDLLLTLLLLFALPAAVQAQFNYTTNQGAITITQYTGPGGAVTIPNKMNGLLVTTIARNAFSSCASVTSVTIGTNVTTIGRRAFWRCTGLTSVTIPVRVTSIGSSPFGWCTNLTNITVLPSNSSYRDVDGVLFDKARLTLVQYPAGRPGKDYTITNSVTSILEGAFGFCTSLTSVAIGDKVSSIGDGAFSGSSCLTRITVHTNNPSFCDVDGVVFDKARLTLVQFPGAKAATYEVPSGVIRIANVAFGYCPGLTNVTVGLNVTTIGHWAFESCTSLASVTFPSSVASIQSYAFNACTSLTSVRIPTNVTNIMAGAFASCLAMAAIAVDSGNPAYSSVDGVLFNKGQTALVQYPAGKPGNDYTMPNTVATIADAALLGCSALSDFKIPDSVSSLDNYAFYNCTRLTGVYFQGNAPSLGSNVFDNANNATVYYLPGATGWGATFGGRPTALWRPLIQGVGIHTNRLGFTIAWAGGRVVTVEACTNLGSPAWSALQTSTLTSDSLYFSDPQWANYTTRFYRLHSP